MTLKSSTTVTCLSNHKKVKNNVPLARQKLLTSKPNTGETINNFLTFSKGLAEHCDYGEKEDNWMRDIVISNVTNKELKRISYRMKAIFKQSHERRYDLF